ncbi:MAG: ATP-binding protein [Spirochaetaceae bacterium]|nr:ATP-binding protein [Spirochaetaceae bacterium]
MPKSESEFYDFDEDKKKNKVKKIKKNDLLNGSETSEMPHLLNTVKAITKYGFSQETIIITSKNNLNMREKLDLTDLEYLILTIYLTKIFRYFCSGAITDFVQGDKKISFSILEALFSMYHKNIFSLMPIERDVCFIASNELDIFLNTGEFKLSKEITLRNIIRNIDCIANLFNGAYPSSIIAEKNILKILQENCHIKYCNKLLEVYESNDYMETHTYLFYIIGHLITQCDGTINLNNSLNTMFCRVDDSRERILDYIYNDDKNILFSQKIFDRAMDESGKADKNKIELHSDFKRKYLHGIIIERKFEEVIEYRKIIKKQMFYVDDNQKHIDDLSNILKKGQFNKVKNRLKKSGMRTGFACLFCGAAGTGKTETAYQIAKKTGRDIIKIDMSSLRSKWWGEDEKNVKAIFTNYRYVLQNSKIEPILLLNEADAIIGKRLNVEGRNGAIITSINATQNIILEELENFEGILIATTNLTQNFDAAFERRFLYKIEFEKPDTKIKQKLWQYMLKLQEEDALLLAKKFDYTGAQIENIYRKREVNNVLYGNKYDILKIIELCEKEQLKDKSRTIGFGN